MAQMMLGDQLKMSYKSGLTSSTFAYSVIPHSWFHLLAVPFARQKIWWLHQQPKLIKHSDPVVLKLRIPVFQPFWCIPNSWIWVDCEKMIWGDYCISLRPRKPSQRSAIQKILCLCQNQQKTLTCEFRKACCSRFQVENTLYPLLEKPNKIFCLAISVLAWTSSWKPLNSWKLLLQGAWILALRTKTAKERFWG